MAFFRSALSTFMFRIVVILSSIVFGISIARTLGPEGRGIWALLALNFVLLTLVSNLGTPESSIFFIGKKIYNKIVILRNLMLFSTVMGLIVILVNTILYYIGINILFNNASNEIFWLSMLVIIPLAIDTQIRHFLLANKRVIAYNILNAFEAIALLILISILLFTDNITVLNVVIAFVITTFLNFGLHLYHVRKELRESIEGKLYQWIIIKKILSNGFAYFFTGMGGFWSSRLNILLIEIYATVSTVGLYTVALAFPNLIANIPNQIGLILYPYVSNETDEKFNYAFTSLIVKLSLIVTALISIPLWIFGNEIILFIYGDEFTGLQIALNYLLLAMILEGTGNLVFNHFAGLGKPIYGTYQFVISISISLLFGLILIPEYGLMGAAISKLIAALASVVFIVFKFSKNYSVLRLLLPTKQDFRIFKKVLSKG
tara:strand:+ start:1872 stop:3167 length:1296 start_codon:yes stop_codon:yes gene_type:complete